MASTVTWRTGASPAGLWRRVLSGAPRERVVVYVADPGPLVRETAQSLLDFLRGESRARRIDVLDAAGDRVAWGPSAVIDLAAEPPLRVDAVRLRAGAAVPALWLEEFFLVTVCAVRPDPRLGLAAVLAAHARLLGGELARDEDLVYEAHRLLAADLSVACGDLRFGDPGSGRWWAASEDDVAVEAAVARAAGGAPARLPHLRRLARHELITLRAEEVGAAPVLQGYLTPAWRTRLARGVAEARYLTRTVAADLRAAAANVHRARGFLERRRAGGPAA